MAKSTQASRPRPRPRSRTRGRGGDSPPKPATLLAAFFLCLAVGLIGVAALFDPISVRSVVGSTSASPTSPLSTPPVAERPDSPSTHGLARPPSGEEPKPTPPARPSSPPPASLASAVRLQIALDRRLFSPGSIDGVLGQQTLAALHSFQRARGLKQSFPVDDATWAALAPPALLEVDYRIEPADLEGLAVTPPSWLEKSRCRALPHQTPLERLAELFHAHPNWLVSLNPGVRWAAVAPGSTIRVPNVLVAETPPLANRLVIFLSKRYLQAYDDRDRLVAHFPCSIATDGSKRPSGTLSVVTIVDGPNYKFVPSRFPYTPEAKTLDHPLMIPPGPNNPVGAVWIGLDRPGYGIHGTPDPENVGRTTSLGCFRLANWNARRLVAMINVGTPVFVFP